DEDQRDAILTVQLREVRLVLIDPLEVDLRRDAVWRVVAKPMRKRSPPTAQGQDEREQKDQANRQPQRHVAVAESTAESCRPRADLQPRDAGRTSFSGEKETHELAQSTRRVAAWKRLRPGRHFTIRGR